MRRVREERRLIALNQMTEPRQGECGWDQQQPDDPVEPDHNHGRETDGNGNHVQRAVDGMVVCPVVVRI